MIFNLTEILKSQEILDQEIHKKYQKTYFETFNERKLALLVVLGAISDKISSFKYWSDETRAEKIEILNEYVDGIHYLSGYCVNFGIDPLFSCKEPKKEPTNAKLTEKLLKIFSLISKLDASKKHKVTVNVIKKTFKNFLELGLLLKINIDEISSSYYKKNERKYISLSN